MFEKFKKTKKFLTEEEKYDFYAEVAYQIEQGQRDTGVWAKAFANADGDEKKAKSIYIELMVQKLILAAEAEIEIQSQIKYEKEKKEKQKEKKSAQVARDAAHTRKTNERINKFGFLYWIPVYLYIPIVGFVSWKGASDFGDIVGITLVYVFASFYLYHVIFLDVILGNIFDVNFKSTDSKNLKKRKKNRTIKKLNSLKEIVKKHERDGEPLYKKHYSTLNDLLNIYYENETFFTLKNKKELKIIVKRALKDLPKAYADDQTMHNKRMAQLKQYKP